VASGFAQLSVGRIGDNSHLQTSIHIQSLKIAAVGLVGEPARGQRFFRDELARRFEACRVGHNQHRGFRGLRLSTEELRREDELRRDN